MTVRSDDIATAFLDIRKLAQKPLDDPKVRPVDTLKLIIHKAEFWYTAIRKEGA